MHCVDAPSGASIVKAAGMPETRDGASFGFRLILACGGLAVGVFQRRRAFAALIFTQGPAASRASLSSRSRAILARTAIARSATSCIALDASSAKMRFRSNFATCSEIAGSGLVLVMTLPAHFVPNYLNASMGSKVPQWMALSRTGWNDAFSRASTFRAKRTSSIFWSCFRQRLENVPQK